MKAQARTNTRQPAATIAGISSGILQRKCMYGTHTIAGGACAGCENKRNNLQRPAVDQSAPRSVDLLMSGTSILLQKLIVGSSNDPLEQEADRIADQLWASSAPFEFSGVPPRIQRIAGQVIGHTNVAPASVDRVLGGSGSAHELTHVVQQPPEPKHEVTIKMEEPDTQNCSADERRQLAIAFPAAKLMAQRATAALSNISRGTGTSIEIMLLKRHFGERARSHLSEIQAGFSKILDNWKDWDSRFDCEKQTEGSCPSADPLKITYAYVRKKRHVFSANQAYGAVHVCAAAFQVKSNMQILSATILHELSHRLDNTDDEKYCGFNSEGLCSTLSTETAIDNADSNAQFAHEIFNASL